jgi:hypothetical protein
LQFTFLNQKLFCSYRCRHSRYSFPAPKAGFSAAELLQIEFPWFFTFAGEIPRFFFLRAARLSALLSPNQKLL